MTATQLLHVATPLHGEGFYLVKKHEFDAREDQVYSIVTAYDEALEKIETDRAQIVKLHAALNKLKAEHKAVKDNFARLHELVSVTGARFQALVAKQLEDNDALKSNVVRVAGAL